MEEKVDVLICGSGSAGICAGLWLARCGIKYKILERRDGPLEVGQADGVQCRTVEIFESFGISDPLLRESYHVLEIAYWTQESTDEGIERSHCAPDAEPHLSHQPHVILNQGRVHRIMLEEMARLNGLEGGGVLYGYDVQTVEVDPERAGDHNEYAVTVKAAKDEDMHTFRAKYILGSDGAHSTVRRALGFKMLGDSSDKIWGVMDVFPRTNFPDIRRKTIIKAAAGSLLLIPREGDAMVRFYMELPAQHASEVTLQDLEERARLIFHPYEMEVAHTAWWSAYSIGQRVADYFTKSHRAFLAGDACHTHSPKAGQGMNVSLQDGYNIGWKLASVLSGFAKPTLLETYVSERSKTARDLIDFDRFISNLFSSQYREEHGITMQEFGEQMTKASRFAACLGVHYALSPVTYGGRGEEGTIATNIQVGTRFPSAQVVRFCDSKVVQLLPMLPSDGRFHIVVFAGAMSPGEGMKKMQTNAASLENSLSGFAPPGATIHEVFHLVLVFNGNRHAIEQSQLPQLFTPDSGRWRVKNLLNVFADDEGYSGGHGKAYEAYGVDPKKGAVVVVRPDQYVSTVCTIETIGNLKDFFSGFLNEASSEGRDT